MTLRENTERPVTITEGTNRLVEITKEKIVSACTQIVNKDRTTGKKPKLWDGKAAERIVQIIASSNKS
jgi:UDP-N-acetylglucosamine 2-epimerase (non-hydrolysing)